MKTGTIDIKGGIKYFFMNKGLKNGNSEIILRQIIEKNKELVKLVESKQKLPPVELAE